MFNKKKKTIPGEDGIAPIKKVNREAVIFLDDAVTCDGSVTLVNGSIMNVDTMFDYLTQEIYDANHKNLPARFLEDERFFNIAKSRDHATFYALNYGFLKEILDCLYSCINNNIFEFLKNITKYSFPLDIKDFINEEQLQIFILKFLDKELYEEFYSTTNSFDTEYYTVKFRTYFKNIIMSKVSYTLYSATRYFIYSRNIEDFKVVQDENTNVKITHDNIYFTLQDMLNYTLVQIDASIDIIIAKYIYSFRRMKEECFPDKEALGIEEIQ